jgi:ribonucleotide reductase class II
MRQFASTDEAAAHAKDNLWQQGDDGKWRIDPERDALRMANHTRVFHRQPTLDEIRESVTKQFYSGEGAIQYAPEAIARANVDVLDTSEKRQAFLEKYEASRELASAYLTWLGADNVEHRMQRYGLNPCGEIIGKDFHCNLSEVHLNTLNPSDLGEQHQAFKAAALAACALLHHKFTNERYQYSREIDPIIGVSFTGLFDFFVTKWGASWLDFWAKGRPEGEAYNFFRKQEAMYLRLWRGWVHDTVQGYCSRHGLRVPNRFTTVQPAGTKSLLTGASPGWHPPKAARFIRRITFAKDDPVALACERFGYRIIPSQSDRDETGALLEDPRDPRCTEWLVEIPTHTTWADLPGCDQYDVSKFSAAAQLDFYMQVQRNYTTHNTSATIEFREAEIEELSSLIHQALGNGYVSAALLARFDSNETFPRLPFEPISHTEYDKLVAEVQARQSTDDFHAAMNSFSNTIPSDESGPAACDSDKCLFSAAVPR